MRIFDRERRSFVLLWVVVALIGFRLCTQSVDDAMRNVPIRVEREGTTVRLWNNGIYDKVVTHLVSGTSEATISPPLLLRSHQGEKDVEIGSLRWKDADAVPVPKPGLLDRIGAVVVDCSARMR